MKKSEKPPYINWDNCIHIEACRRFARIVEAKTGKHIARGCGEKCCAYQSKNKMIEKLNSIVDDIETHKVYLREEISTQLYGIADNNEIIRQAISNISTYSIDQFIKEEITNDE